MTSKVYIYISQHTLHKYSFNTHTLEIIKLISKQEKLMLTEISYQVIGY